MDRAATTIRIGWEMRNLSLSGQVTRVGLLWFISGLTLILLDVFCCISNDVWSNNPGSGTGKVSNLRFENITSVSENGVMISGRGGLVEGIELVNVRLIIQQRPKNNASNGPHPSHNYHPTNPDSTTTPPHWDPEGDMPDKDAPVDGFFVEHASQVTFEGCSVSFVGQAEPGNSFGGCVRLGNGTHGVQPVQLTTCRLPAR